MCKRPIILLIALAVIAGLPVVTGAQISDKTGVTSLEQYFDMLSSENFDIAGDMWVPSALERSARFGITYDDVLLKVDCASPVIRHFELLRYQLQPPVKRYEILGDSSWSKLEFSKLVNEGRSEHMYYMQRHENWYWLNFPQDYYARDWKVVESEYFRVHVDPRVEPFLNDATLNESDRFVAAMCDTLGIPDDLRDRIAREKIEYFYCGDDSLVKEITGHRIRGTVDLPSNDIISAAFPHFHELTHLLVNIRLQTLPLYTLPLLREGTAVRLGGRWGKHAAPLMELAVFLYREKIVELDSILTMKDFDNNSSADIVYPLAGVVSGFMIDRMGMDDYLEAYRRASGPFNRLYAMTAEDVRQLLMEATGYKTWQAFVTELEGYMDDLTANATARPGGLDNGKALAAADGYSVQMYKDWLAFEFVGTDTATPPRGILLFGKNDGLTGQQSSLFKEQTSNGAVPEGYRYGVQFDQNEAGLYDYATNQLLAKYIWGITPSPDYFDAEKGTVRICFKKDILKKTLPESGHCTLVRQ